LLLLEDELVAIIEIRSSLRGVLLYRPVPYEEALVDLRLEELVACLGICYILLFELSLLFLDVVIDFGLLGKTLEDLTLCALCGLEHFVGFTML